MNVFFRTLNFRVFFPRGKCVPLIKNHDITSQEICTCQNVSFYMDCTWSMYLMVKEVFLASWMTIIIQTIFKYGKRNSMGNYRTINARHKIWLALWLWFRKKEKKTSRWVELKGILERGQTCSMEVDLLWTTSLYMYFTQTRSICMLISLLIFRSIS